MRDSGLTLESLSLPFFTVNHKVSGGVGAFLSQLPIFAYWTSFLTTKRRSFLVFVLYFFYVASCGGFRVVGAAFSEGASMVGVFCHSARGQPQSF